MKATKFSANSLDRKRYWAEIKALQAKTGCSIRDAQALYSQRKGAKKAIATANDSVNRAGVEKVASHGVEPQSEVTVQSLLDDADSLLQRLIGERDGLRGRLHDVEEQVEHLKHIFRSSEEPGPLSTSELDETPEKPF